ncbi:MAG: AbrB/MazE/SpoVT family DNA-binding domain-containing protein [Armatimonadetes bacterium]|nr:AbrB/MazE/SpoVT family DNA-binding domain-containing protein [Armatimonadota bacterium]
MATTIEVARRGQMTIPKALRDRYRIEQGDKFTVRALPGGVLVLTPRRGQANEALNRLRDALVSEGASLDAMLAQLRRMREEPDEADGA